VEAMCAREGAAPGMPAREARPVLRGVA
jgi:hypothetical protein